MMNDKKVFRGATGAQLATAITVEYTVEFTDGRSDR